VIDRVGCEQEYDLDLDLDHNYDYEQEHEASCRRPARYAITRLGFQPSGQRGG
jgi:hypothetical protein